MSCLRVRCLQNCTQQEIYDQSVRPLVDAAIAGYNATIFAYGQTGTRRSKPRIRQPTAYIRQPLTPKPAKPPPYQALSFKLPDLHNLCFPFPPSNTSSLFSTTHKLAARRLTALFSHHRLGQDVHHGQCCVECSRGRAGFNASLFRREA
eukprot:3907051-Rhodomonas_salina.2